MEFLDALILLVPAIITSTTGELLLKHGMNQVGRFEFSRRGLLAALPRIVTNPSIVFGFIGFGGGAVFWLAVLSRVPLSIAYPTLALSYFIVVVEAWLLLKERVTWQRLLGVAIIFAGVVIIGLSES
jgi:drug/metabolite transporter (DMT)-like permease